MRYERSHSLFGMLWQVVQATGWSLDYVLWGVNWETLVMMLADAPRYVKEKRRNGRMAKQKAGGKRTAEEILELFQTQLKKN